MTFISKSIQDLIGDTPLLQPNRFLEKHGINGNFFVKLEFFNPAGSVKDRVGLAMLQQARESGRLREGSVIIEPTSGNTGIGLAAVAASMGYRVILTMPETMSQERRSLLAAYGAEIVLTEGAKGMAGAVERAQEIAAATKNSYMPAQFENPENPRAHYNSTGPEIWRATQGGVDVFIAGVGTGGTISGVGKYLKEQKPDIQVIAVEPETSPLLSQGRSGAHRIQGIGANFVPQTLDTAIYDKILAVSDEDAFAMMRDFVTSEGLLIGISSGAALAAAVRYAQSPQGEGKTIVTLLPDGGERYLSMGIF